MSWNFDLKVGQIREYLGSEQMGRINRSSLTVLKGQSQAQYFSIKYVLEGEEKYIVDGNPIKVKSGQVLFVRPHQELEVDINSNHQTEGLCLFIHPNLVPEGLKSNAALLFPSFPIASSNWLKQNITKHLQTERNVDHLLLKSAQQMSYFLLDANQKLHTLSAKKQSTQLSIWEKLEQSKFYLQLNLDKNIKLEHIAQQACISPFHYQRLFSAFFGCSPHQYLRQIRLQKAKELLHQKQHIKEVALACGFEDAKYLKKCLKKFSSNKN